MRSRKFEVLTGGKNGRRTEKRVDRSNKKIRMRKEKQKDTRN